MTTWTKVCQLDDIIPATGVCALLVDANGVNKQVAIFRPRDNEELFAVDNMDPFAKSYVLSRGIIAEHAGEMWVASPLKKQRFNLRTGQCLENDTVSIPTYQVRVNGTDVELSTN